MLAAGSRKVSIRSLELPRKPPLNRPTPTSKQAHRLECSGLLKVYYFNGELFLKDDKIHLFSSRKETEACPRDQKRQVDRSPTRPDSQADRAQASPPLPWHLKMRASGGEAWDGASHPPAGEQRAQCTGRCQFCWRKGDPPTQIQGLCRLQGD